MSSEKKKIMDKMNELKILLAERYPARTYCHVDIFTAYWCLENEIREDWERVKVNETNTT